MGASEKYLKINCKQRRIRTLLDVNFRAFLRKHVTALYTSTGVDKLRANIRSISFQSNRQKNEKVTVNFKYCRENQRLSYFDTHISDSVKIVLSTHEFENI